jgi:hypothetical protein
MKFNNICPACNNDVFTHDSTLVEITVYSCVKCKCKIHVNGITNEIGAYFFDTVYRNISYEMCFYFKDYRIGNRRAGSFVIEYCDIADDGRIRYQWKKVLELSFHPNINIHNINTKLPVILAFL